MVGISSRVGQSVFCGISKPFRGVRKSHAVLPFQAVPGRKMPEPGHQVAAHQGCPNDWAPQLTLGAAG